MFGPRLEIEFAGRILADHLIGLGGLHQSAIYKIQRIVIWIARDVIHQIEQRDVRRTRQMREVLAHRVVDGEFSRFSQQQDGGASELFGHRANRENGVMADRRWFRQRTQTVSFGENNPPVFHNGNGKADAPFVLNLLAQKRINPIEIE